MRTRAMRHRALLASRLPPRLRRWRWVRPEDAGQGADTAEGGEAGFAAEPVGVVAGGDEQGAGGVGADPEQGDEAGRGFRDEAVEVVVELGDLVVQPVPT